MQTLEKILIVGLVSVATITFIIGANALTALGVMYIAAELFGATWSFWPTFVLVIILTFFISQFRLNNKE